MAEPAKESQPQSTVERFNSLAAALPPEPQAPEAEASPAAADGAPVFDPATYKIPDSATPNSPKSFEKFKNKTLSDVFTSYENAEQQMHLKAEEASRARRENEELRTRLAAAEQVARMVPQAPLVQPSDHWQRAGVNPDEQTFTAPRQMFDTTLSIAAEGARRVAAEEAKKESQSIRAELKARDDANAIFQTFEAAREELNKAGYEVPIETWRENLKYIAPVVLQEGQIFNSKRYVEHYVALRGAPTKGAIPAEGTPPIATRAAAVNHDSGVPTLSREDKQLQKRIRAAMGLPD